MTCTVELSGIEKKGSHMIKKIAVDFTYPILFLNKLFAANYVWTILMLLLPGH
jgi:hypothetical protein